MNMQMEVDDDKMGGLDLLPFVPQAVDDEELTPAEQQYDDVVMADARRSNGLHSQLVCGYQRLLGHQKSRPDGLPGRDATLASFALDRRTGTSRPLAWCLCRRRSSRGLHLDKNCEIVN